MVNKLDEAMRENAEIPPESDATNSRLVSGLRPDIARTEPGSVTAESGTERPWRS